MSTSAHISKKRCQTARELARQSERALTRSEELIEQAARLVERCGQRVLNTPRSDQPLP